ncbi:tripartite tricarboxylate transporter permease [Acuticoccus sp. I52.16.1]|uniref:tripartite tricarboxylate transporter permease n=1 Tax=Acuticoccus sp. I52.16.1 TaxID=2928472 RepID=UPI001FD081FB|nr:tripartite tricarboxylate transporter permease [Acuticoccus sp. I52.16.1]UOM33281.1 tripartite tricarboxylate transporter permease [Acuticoccus sp. I52.16.1]
MTFVDNLSLGFQTALTPEALLFCFAGVTLGTLVGVLPGIGALATISMCLPLTFYLDPTVALIMLAGIFYGAQYGSSTAAILLNIPGTATAAATCLDGHPMARNGRAGVALFMTSIASFVGGSFAIALLILFAPMLANVAVRFTSAEYFAIMLLGLVAASTLSVGSPIKGLAMVFVGIAVGLAGMDVNTGTLRFAFGSYRFADGFSLVAVAMGIFGISEIIKNLAHNDAPRIERKAITFRSLVPTRADWRASWGPMGRSSVLGSAVGILPGAGPSIAAFMAYAMERKLSRHPEKFGTGTVEGVVAPEAANNASVQAAFIPTLSLGIPGDAVMAVLIGALMIHGIAPGPLLVVEHPEMFWGLVASFWVGNVLLLVLNIPFIGLWVRVLTIPYRVLYPAMLFFICVGVYSVNNSVFDVYVAMGFGVIGYLLMLYNFPIAPLLLGYILGPLMEQHLRRTLLISRGDILVFLERPVSAALIGLTLAILVWMAVSQARKHSAKRAMLTRPNG